MLSRGDRGEWDSDGEMEREIEERRECVGERRREMETAREM